MRTDLINAAWLAEAYVYEGFFLDMERFWWHDADTLDSGTKKTPEYFHAMDALFKYQRDRLGVSRCRAGDRPPVEGWPLEPHREAIAKLHQAYKLNPTEALQNYTSLMEMALRKAMQVELTGRGSEELRSELLTRIKKMRSVFEDSR